MNQHPIQLLDPVYRWLNLLIHDHGEYLYLGFVFVSLPILAWILSGGLRRKLRTPTYPPGIWIVVISPTAQPPPPVLHGGTEAHRRGPDDDIQSFSA